MSTLTHRLLDELRGREQTDTVRALADVLAPHRRSTLPAWHGPARNRFYCLACSSHDSQGNTAFVPYPCRTLDVARHHLDLPATEGTVIS